MSEPKQVNFTIVADETTDAPRTYANFCAIAHTPFDCTLSFCEVLPLGEGDIRAVESGATEHVVKAPVRARIVLPLQSLPAILAALQEHVRGMPPIPQGPVH